MDENTYLKLLAMVTPMITRMDTIMRNSISAHERLSVTLRFLATGRSYEDLKFSSIISPQALGKIIPETCEALYKVLRKGYLKFPTSEEEWKEIAKMYEERWNFPHCLGAIDGKHIAIVPPGNSGSYFYNYKGHHSVVLMAIANAKYQFVYIDAGMNGRICDGGVLQNTVFFEKLENNELHIPSSETITGSNLHLPYVFLADDAFPLRPDMIKPFRQGDLTSRERKIFNYRLSRARRTVENAFGIMASRFRIYYTHINLEPKNIDKVVKASCALHNFLIEHSKKSYASLKCFYRENSENRTIISEGYDTKNSTMENLERRNPGNTLNTAKTVREDFMNHFNAKGRVPWQDDHVN
ncbi:unnamed protein product [Acanthoscelides obtectus]|uniref:DDE Tnp4 domain-containing protein n=1 Tax=Acanthoscelides obtectus TaxID=200917 RepID=A0A9P0Q688_ACAOB|nr:unnamed protein product [Acanthoscelides obtectus]CAK1680419.1 Protein ALP1-like [Acanthoscelides obtectus]